MPSDWTISKDPTPPSNTGGWTISKNQAPPSTGLADQYSGVHEGTTIQAPSQGPVSNWLENLEGDIKHGTESTLPGKIAHKLGFQGIERGEGGGEGGVGDIMGGEVLGPTEAAHGFLRTQNPNNNLKAKVQGTNELIRGVFKTPGPAAALIPGAVPGVTLYGGAGHLASKAAEAAGASPDTAELVGNATSLAAPFAHPVVSGAGKLIQDQAPNLGKTAGYGTALYQTLKTGNPIDLLYGSKPVTKAAEAGIRSLGKGVEGVGNVQAPLIDQSDFTGTAGPRGEVLPTDSQVQDKFARNVMGMRSGASFPQESTQPLLESGALIPQASEAVYNGSGAKPSASEETPMWVPGQAQIIRGKGGRMTKQFTAQPSTGEPQYNPPPAWSPPELPPQAPPNAGIVKGDAAAGPRGEVLPPDNDEDGLIRDGLIQAPKNVTQPLTNEQASPIINSDIADDRERNAELIQGMERDQAAADEHAKKTFYKNNKADIGKTTQKRAGADFDENELLPWARSSWENEPQYEPGEGEAAGTRGGKGQSHFMNPFTGEHEPEPEFLAEDLNDRYRDQVLEGMAKTHGELIDTRDLAEGLGNGKSFAEMRPDKYAEFNKRNPISGEEDLNPEIRSVPDYGEEERSIPGEDKITDDQKAQEEKITSAYDYLVNKGFDPLNIDQFSFDQLLRHAENQGWKPPVPEQNAHDILERQNGPNFIGGVNNVLDKYMDENGVIPGMEHQPEEEGDLMEPDEEYSLHNTVGEPKPLIDTGEGIQPPTDEVLKYMMEDGTSKAQALRDWRNGSPGLRQKLLELTRDKNPDELRARIREDLIHTKGVQEQMREAAAKDKYPPYR